jgi:hypothetical protein
MPGDISHMYFIRLCQCDRAVGVCAAEGCRVPVARREPRPATHAGVRRAKCVRGVPVTRIYHDDDGMHVRSRVLQSGATCFRSPARN